MSAQRVGLYTAYRLHEAVSQNYLSLGNESVLFMLVTRQTRRHNVSPYASLSVCASVLSRYGRINKHCLFVWNCGALWHFHSPRIYYFSYLLTYFQ